MSAAHGADDRGACVVSLITPDIAEQTLHYYGHGGYPGGAFVVALQRAITHADNGNRLRLMLGFPGYVRAAHLIERSLDGVDVLRQIAGEGRCCEHP